MNHSLTDTEKIKIHEAPSAMCRATFLTKPPLMAVITIVSSFVGAAVAVVLWDGEYKSKNNVCIAEINKNIEAQKEKIEKNEKDISELKAMQETLNRILEIVSSKK
jgi:uncharacterized membrane-anchored protein YitT (DUF2179 family)